MSLILNLVSCLPLLLSTAMTVSDFVELAKTCLLKRCGLAGLIWFEMKHKNKEDISFTSPTFAHKEQFESQLQFPGQ